jgi:hypothetical protein
MEEERAYALEMEKEKAQALEESTEAQSRRALSSPFLRKVFFFVPDKNPASFILPLLHTLFSKLVQHRVCLEKAFLLQLLV